MRQQQIIAKPPLIRLKDYDYDTADAYLITVCSKRAPVFGNAESGIISAIWEAIPRRFPGVEPEVFVVMPNHVHGIIVITDQAPRQNPAAFDAGRQPVVEGLDVPLQAADPSAPTTQILRVQRSLMLLPRIVSFFKSVSAKRIDTLRGTGGIPVWQRNYYEHVVRSEAELSRIRQYIIDNPVRWDEDPKNPAIAKRVPVARSGRSRPSTTGYGLPGGSVVNNRTRVRIR